MRKIAMMAAALLVAAPAWAADPLEGLWRTAKDDNGNSGLVQVKPCGGGLCGTLIKAYGPGGKEIKSENVGRQIISQTQPSGGGQYKGKVYSPDRGKTYNSKLVLSGSTLKVSGCVLGICRDGGTWKKVK
ncbi:DUF2147 domain-containing protein [Vannielia litorea]|uniref:DUF2147 domain-containing protein n=1 Tax=Vannielia litorea TaxID=1217970 RepID=UPI001C97E886|nr:DUF2147 domain-containing protein [Vannielia litorea]MBY6046561.1 DUF2147 domain-containing protein [Vannielia litorea]MBY6073974.1 DUF2147 domain-containing protein [Vannielia litorea]